MNWFRYLLFQVPEQRVPDELGPLKNEIHRLSEENIKLQSLLNDLNSSIKDQKKNAIDSKGWVYGLGAKLIYMGYFASLLYPPGRKTWLLFSVRDMS